MKFMVDSVIKKNFDIQRSLSPVGGGGGRASPKRKDKFSTGFGLNTKNQGHSTLNASRLNTSVVQTSNKLNDNKGGKGNVNSSKAKEDPYNPFQITDLEMKRIKQTVCLSDESLKKLWERE